jgi:hypothetical protein
MAWLEAHESLSGWAQFAGAMLALGVTYLTAFWPIWRRKRQLRNAGLRLIANGYEALESYSRTSEYGDLVPVSVRQAALTLGMVADEIARFPIYELDDQGSNSLARRMVATGMIVSSMKLALGTVAADLDERPMTQDDRLAVRELLGVALARAEDSLLGRISPRPEPPGQAPSTPQGGQDN